MVQPQRKNTCKCEGSTVLSSSNIATHLSDWLFALVGSVNDDVFNVFSWLVLVAVEIRLLEDLSLGTEPTLPCDLIGLFSVSAMQSFLSYTSDTIHTLTDINAIESI